MSNQRYDIGTQLFETSMLKLLYISASQYDKDWHSTMHSHQCTELFYVISGQGEFQIEEVSFSVVAGDLVAINPNIMHTEKSIHRSPMEYIVLGLDGGGILLDEISDPRYCAFQCGKAAKDILFYMRQILSELEQRPPYFSTVANNMLEILYIKLLRYKAVSVQLEPATKQSRECAFIKRYIDTNYMEAITLDTLAEITHLNKYYLAHTFTKEYDIAPINYLIDRRIKESRYYLSNTDYRITQIAQLVGFSSASYFSQAFHKAESISPKEYRLRYRKS